MKANTEVLEHLAAEVARLENQRAAAQAEAERATQRLEELGARREALAPVPSVVRLEDGEYLLRRLRSPYVLPALNELVKVWWNGRTRSWGTVKEK